MIELVAPILSLCIEGNTFCFRSKYRPVQYYQPGRACYIQGRFYPDCRYNPFEVPHHHYHRRNHH